MSAEEDTELRDLLSQALETNGSLAKIRAQLRACLFLAFDEDELIQKKQPLLNSKIKQHISTPEGKLMFSLVREFLQFFNLDFTISVYEPESYLGTEYFYEGRTKLAQNLKLDVNESVPLLLQLIKITQEYKPNTKKETLTVNGLQNQNGVDHSSTVVNKNGLNVLNQTFDVSSPTVEQIEEKVDTPRSVEDTYEGTSSIAEDDSVKEKCLIDLDKSVKSSSNNSHHSETPRSLLDATINDFSPPILKEGKAEKKVSPQKQEKLKGLNYFPPLQLNKLQNRSNEIKDRDKEFDKLLESDLLDNYEEDFMSGSEVDVKSDKSMLNSKGFKGLLDRTDASFKDRNDSVASSVTSEDFELNSNVDDILNSNNS